MDVYSHRMLGIITETMRVDLTSLASGAEGSDLTGTYTSAQLAILRDIASLQVKANRTFGTPTDRRAAWWVTRSGLQQSTHHAVARFKASWFDDSRVVDLCCGLGSDLIALARRGPVVGIDIDHDLLCFTRANLTTAGQIADLRGIDVVTTPVHQLVNTGDWVHVDPDRRVDGKRHTFLQDLTPDWDRTTALLSGCRGGVVKLAPATDLDDPRLNSNVDKDAMHRVWISSGGSVREQSVLAGGMLDCDWMRSNGLRPGGRTAVNLRGRRSLVFSTQSASRLPINAPEKAIGNYLIDPNSAIRAAGLTEAFADSLGARPVDLASGFLTADAIPVDGEASDLSVIARVLEVVGCDDRKLRRCFRARDAYPDVIKVRGGDQNPETLSKRLKDCGDRPLGLWIGRNGKKVFAAITELPVRQPNRADEHDNQHG